MSMSRETWSMMSSHGDIWSFALYICFLFKYVKEELHAALASCSFLVGKTSTHLWLSDGTADA